MRVRLQEGGGRSGARVAWIDAARGLGMIAVYYGHVINPLVHLGNDDAFSQFKLVYSFHMPLFFVLAGFVSRPRVRVDLGAVLDKARTRLVPAYLFCGLALLVEIAINIAQGRPYWMPPFAKPSDLLIGTPTYNHITWFLFLLFAVDLLHLALARFEGGLLAEILWLLGLFALGGWIASESKQIVAWMGLRRAPLYCTEAVAAYALFRVGRGLRRIPWPRPGEARQRSILWALVAGVVVLATFDLNHGPWTWHVEVVMMSAMSHGNVALFALTAVAGSLMIIHLSCAVPPLRPLLFLGRNSLALLGLNGLFMAFVNKPVARALAPSMADSHWQLFGVAALLTAASLALCVPAILLFNRYLPWIVGRRRAGSAWG